MGEFLHAMGRRLPRRFAPRNDRSGAVLMGGGPAVKPQAKWVVCVCGGGGGGWPAPQVCELIGIDGGWRGDDFSLQATPRANLSGSPTHYPDEA